MNAFISSGLSKQGSQFAGVQRVITSNLGKMSRICFVGLNCLDVISFIPRFVQEDSESRCTRQVWARGGNASNNATVFACLGREVEFFGTLAKDHLLNFFLDDMKSLGIKHDNCPILEGIERAPVSAVLCSEATGSRTIVHHNGDLPDLSVSDFRSRINLDQYTWAHFEGRNEVEVEKMIGLIHEYNSRSPLQEENSEPIRLRYKAARVPVSVEVEKCRESLSTLISLAHVVFLGKDFASWKGAENCVQGVALCMKDVGPGSVVICAWGEDGAAYGIKGGSSGGDVVEKVNAFPQEKIIDSLGAGDTFIATTISCLSNGLDVKASVKMGCRVASEKLGMYGFLGLKEKAADLLSPLT